MSDPGEPPPIANSSTNIAGKTLIAPAREKNTQFANFNAVAMHSAKMNPGSAVGKVITSPYNMPAAKSPVLNRVAARATTVTKVAAKTAQI